MLGNLKHAAIPLTVSLRKERGSYAECTKDKDFVEILDFSAGCLKNSLVLPRCGVTWDFEYENLWCERFKGTLFVDLSYDDMVFVLDTRTFWYKRLKPNMKLYIKHLLSNGRKGILQLKEILHCADGIISSLIVSFPECLKVKDPEGESAYTITDRIINNVITNGLMNYKQQMVKWKKFKKELKKCAFLKKEYTPSRSKYRDMSWVFPICEYYNKVLSMRNSKEKMFRITSFCQTRNTGLANKEMVKATIDEFVEEVTTVKSFDPTPLLIECIDEVCTRVVEQAEGPHANFKISMSTSACTEMRSKDEGKFGFVKSMISQNKLPPFEKFSPDNPGAQLGNYAFAEARHMIQNRDPSIFKTNVAGVRENGKCRVVTAGSFYKDALLQPLSHLTIEMLKSEPLLKDGFQAARLGYKFVEGINHLDPSRGEILFEDEVYAMSFDWTKATDRPSHKSAHLTMGTLLKKMRLPQGIIDDVLTIWPGQKTLHIGGKEVGVQVNGIPMGDPLTKTNLSIVHPICSLYADKKVGKLIGIGVGNGDDGVEIKAGPKALEWFDAFLESSRILGYDLSHDDHFVTRDWFTYCEEVAMIPIDRFHTVMNANRLSDDRLLPYIDVPKFRLVIDTKKDREDYSSDPQGKYTLMGKDLEYVRKGGNKQLCELFNIASSCQDVCLGLKYRKTPVYIPRQIYGCGKIPGFWNVESWYNAIKSQSKTCQRITFVVMEELLNKREPLISRIKGVLTKEKHFKNESYFEINEIPKDDPIRRYICVQSSDRKLFPEGVLDKLIGAGILVPQSKIEAFYLFQRRLEDMTQDKPEHDLFETVKAMCIEIKDPSDESLKSTIKEFREMFVQSPWTLRSRRIDDLYPIEILKVLQNSNPLRVDLNEFEYKNRFVSLPKPDSPYTRGINRLREWFDNNYECVINGGEYELPPVDVIQDDDIIVLQVERSTCNTIILITNDQKLVRRCNNIFTNKEIWSISVENWVNHDADESSFSQALKERVPGITIEFIVDQGALETFLMKTDIDPVKYGNFQSNIDRSKVRTQEEIYDVYLPPNPLNKTNIFDIVKISRQSKTSRRGALPHMR